MSEKTFLVDDTEPIRCGVTRGAFSNPMMQEVLRKFGKRAFARSSACMEFESFLRRIKAGGGTCLEIGTYNGITAVVLSQFFDRVVCVSVDEPALKRQIIKRDIVAHHLLDLYPGRRRPPGSGSLQDLYGRPGFADLVQPGQDEPGLPEHRRRRGQVDHPAHVDQPQRLLRLHSGRVVVQGEVPVGRSTLHREWFVPRSSRRSRSRSPRRGNDSRGPGLARR